MFVSTYFNSLPAMVCLHLWRNIKTSFPGYSRGMSAASPSLTVSAHQVSTTSTPFSRSTGMMLYWWHPPLRKFMRNTHSRKIVTKKLTKGGWAIGLHIIQGAATLVKFLKITSQQRAAPFLTLSRNSQWPFQYSKCWNNAQVFLFCFVFRLF